MNLRPYLYSLSVLLLAAVLSVAIGSVFIPPDDLWRVIAGRTPQAVTQAAFIVSAIRLPRTVLVALTGAALGGSGAAYQGVFRNPLADPYLIGVASGAGLGAVLAMSIEWPYTAPGMLVIPLAAFTGALATILLVYFLARVGKTVPATNLVLAGVAVSAFASAITSFLMLGSTGELHRAIAWLLGGSTQVGWGPVWAVLPFMAVGMTSLLVSGHALNLLQFGDDQAQQMGLPVTRARILVLLAASLTTAAAVAFSGIIGFLGLIIPHLVRLRYGADYRRLLPLSMLGGAAGLLLADVLARVLMAPQELPVGVVTAIAGVPFFLWALRREKSQGLW
ncbi:MAG: iron ABC transporter permease [Chloroflexi bacterium]|nr:iron ABC transporter permease [Chloroflexota bacterium]